MLGDLFDKFKGMDGEKLSEVVHLVWDNRDKLLDLIERLPQLLEDSGNRIESAGSSAVNAALFLTGDEKKGKISAAAISTKAAKALDRCFHELSVVSAAMTKIGQELDDVRIPSIRTKHREIAGIRVISGVEVGESSLLDNAADRLQGGSKRLASIGDELKDVAVGLRQLGGALTDAGGDLNNVGVQLMYSGATLRSMGNFGEKDSAEAPSTNKPADSGGWEIG